jgi:uncharacterized protein YkwD
MVAKLALCASIVLAFPFLLIAEEGASGQTPAAPAPQSEPAAKPAAPPAAQPAAKPTPAAPAQPEAKPEQQAAAAKTEEFELLQIEKNIIERTNAERARYGLPPLAADVDLVKSARNHAIWMTTYQRLQHTNQPVAENIAMGQRDSQEVLNSWMNSSGHRANILNGGHRRIGVAAYRTVQGTIFWCQQFRN